MSTPRFQRVAQLWNWLPAFRGVAEHEGIHGAAAALNVSASALSRTVKLLERAVGVALFVREPSGLRLTPAGSALLAATRDGMRAIDDWIERHRPTTDLGGSPFCIGTTSDLTAALLAWSVAVPSPERPIVIRATHEELLATELLHGHLDLALATMEVTDEALVCESVGRLRFGLYASPKHPLAGATGPIAGDRLAREQVVVPSVLDRPPAGVIVATADSVAMLRGLCAAGSVLAVLPDPLEAATRELVRLGSASSIAVYAVTRRPLDPSAPVGAFGAELTARLRRLLA